MMEEWKSEMDLLDFVAKNYRKLGYVGIFEFNRSSGFPDFTFIEKDGNLVKVEIETKISHFFEHYHQNRFEPVLDYQAVAYWINDDSSEEWPFMGSGKSLIKQTFKGIDLIDLKVEMGQ